MIRIEESENLLILRAQRSKDSIELNELSKCNFANVRRCVAKNRFTPKNIINQLAYDPVSNVSYVALSNNLCTAKRKIDAVIHKCVLCTKDEATYKYECAKCN